jgi:hypothetical protein
MTNAHIYEETYGPMNVSYSRTEGEYDSNSVKLLHLFLAFFVFSLSSVRTPSSLFWRAKILRYVLN